MRVELLVVPSCPHEAPARQAIEAALALTGHPGEAVTTVVIATEEDAVRAGFTGSPSFFVDGTDLMPEPGAAPVLACRLAIPSADALAAAIRARSGPAGGTRRQA